MDSTDGKQGESLDGDAGGSLETGASAAGDKPAAKGVIDATSGGSAAPAPAPSGKKAPKSGGVKGKLARVNIYFLGFILALLIAGMALFIGIKKSQKEATPTQISSQTLSTDAINQLKGNDVKIGDAKQTLNVESNAVFAGRVLVQGGVDIAGALKVSGILSLVNLTVSGTGTFQQAQVGELAVSGGAGIQGQLTVQKSINVTGGGSFGGAVTIPQLTVDTLALSKDLQLARHIDAGGNTPGLSDGTALGAGGTSSISGTDTAGTVSISTGSSPAAGCFVTVTFSQKFSGTPHVVVSPASSDAGALSYYTSRNTTGFSICATNPVAAKNYIFDFIAID